MDTTKINELLARHVADAALLAAEGKAWHWNVTGPNFGDLHALFDQITEHARAATDELAERVVQLRGTPPAFAGEWLEHTTLDQPTGTRPGAGEMLAHIEESLTRISDAARADIGAFDELGDPATADILTAWLEVIDKDRWMVRAHRA